MLTFVLIRHPRNEFKWKLKEKKRFHKGKYLNMPSVKVGLFHPRVDKLRKDISRLIARTGCCWLQTPGKCFNIKTIFPGIQTLIIKIRQFHDHLHNRNSYTGKIASLFWHRLWSQQECAGDPVNPLYAKLLQTKYVSAFFISLLDIWT